MIHTVNWYVDNQALQHYSWNYYIILYPSLFMSTTEHLHQLFFLEHLCLPSIVLLFLVLFETFSTSYQIHYKALMLRSVSKHP